MSDSSLVFILSLSTFIPRTVHLFRGKTDKMKQRTKCKRRKA